MGQGEPAIRNISDTANWAAVVVNLAAGLDARPYRMPLPSSLLWVQVDLPAILAFLPESNDRQGSRPGEESA